MKRLLPVLLAGMMAVAACAASTHATAADAPAATLELPEEVSAVLMSDVYATTVRALVADATQQGKTLELGAYAVTRLGEFGTYVHIALWEKVTASVGGPWTNVGSVVGSVVFDPLGNASCDGAYFAPAAEPAPGGGVSN